MPTHSTISPIPPVAISTTALLDKGDAAERRKLIAERAVEPLPGEPVHGDTVYISAVGENDMMVSFIQSNYTSFGAGIVVASTGIALQKRGRIIWRSPTGGYVAGRDGRADRYAVYGD